MKRRLKKPAYTLTDKGTDLAHQARQLGDDFQRQRERLQDEIAEQVLTLQDERQDARAERDRAEGVLVSLIRQLLPGARPVYLHSAGIRELDRWTLNEMLARHGLRVRSKATHSERLVKVHIDGERWAGHTHFWLEPLPAAGVAESDGDSDQAEGRDAV